MEKKFYTDDFEHFLKDTTDNFRMYPSKRVWNSIYNDRHPGRKWPSLIIWLLLISSVTFIGISNNNEVGSTKILLTKNDVSPKITSYSHFPIRSSVPADSRLNNSLYAVVPERTLPLVSADSIDLGKDLNKSSQSTNSHLPVLTSTASTINGYTDRYNKENSTKEHIQYQLRSTNGLGNFLTKETFKLSQSEDPVSPDIANFNSNTSVQAQEITAEKLLLNNLKGISLKPLLPHVVSEANKMEEKEWIENYAFHHQPVHSFKSNILYEFYITPSIGYRTLTRTAVPVLYSRSSSATTTTSELQHSINEYSALNLEAGYSLLYNYSKGLRLKAGVQFNYTNYDIRAEELAHSTITSLFLNDANSGGTRLSQRSSTLANVPVYAANTKLNSSTFQVSIPLGADLKIVGKNKLSWFVGATIQPTYVLGGNAYLLSADMKNYVYDASFLRKFNINTGVETFLSYKSKNGVTLNAGPQFRYQLQSTYNKTYPFNEKLYNLGVKMGITRNL